MLPQPELPKGINEGITALGNKGPPVFLSKILDQEIYANDISTVELPQVFEPDNDMWEVQLNSGQANFIKVVRSSLVFKPKLAHALEIPYTIKVTLTDKHAAPKSSDYIF